LDKGTALTLDIVIAELLSVHDRTERERILDETEKRQKSDQMALIAKLSLNSSAGGSTPGTKKKFKKGKFKPWKRPTDTTCHNCGEKGHWSLDCPKKGESRDGHSKPGGSAHIAIQSSGSREVGKMLMATGSNCEVRQADMASVVGSITGILLDCAATSHMFMECHLFITYEALTNNEYITVGGWHQVPVAGIGSVSLNMILPNGTSTLTLTDAFHIPTLGANLVSLGVLHRKGASVQSWINGLIISKNNKDLFSATLGGSTGTLYQIQCTDYDQGSAYMSTGPLSMHLWHRRMGHLSPKMINSMLHERVIKELEIRAPKDFDQLCNGCANGKSHRSPMPETSASKYSKMELLVMDLTGPIMVPTWDSYQYALVVIEVSCCYAVGWLLREKDEAGVAVWDIVAMLERQSGLKARRLRSDNESEFVNSMMTQFCQKNGIIHETTIPYLPEQNRTAERVIAIFFEMVRCMLWSAGVDLRYWGDVRALLEAAPNRAQVQ